MFWFVGVHVQVVIIVTMLYIFNNKMKRIQIVVSAHYLIIVHVNNNKHL